MVMIINIVVNYVLNIICKTEIPNVRPSTMLRLGVTDTLNEKKIIIIIIIIIRRQSQLYMFYVLYIHNYVSTYTEAPILCM